MMYRLFALALAAIAMLVTPAFADPSPRKKRKAEALVGEATETLRYFTNSRDHAGLWDTVVDAKAMIVIPNSYRGGFLFGGSGGDAIMMARNADGSWSGPTFLSIGSFSFGLQAGGEVSEIILLAMTDRGKEHLLETSVKLGGDVSIAAGPIGAGAKAKTTDILAFSRSRGLYGGISLEGTVLKARYNLNRSYYGLDVTPTEIVYRGVPDNPASLPLREAAWQLSQRAQAEQNDEPSVATRAAPVGSTASAPPQGYRPEVYESGLYGEGDIDLPEATSVNSAARIYSSPDDVANPGRGAYPSATPQGGMRYEDDAIYGIPAEGQPYQYRDPQDGQRDPYRLEGGAPIKSNEAPPRRP